MGLSSANNSVGRNRRRCRRSRLRAARTPLYSLHYHYRVRASAHTRVMQIYIQRAKV